MGVILEIMKPDGKDWTSRWFYTDYFITEYLFSIRIASFKSRYFKLSIDISLMSVCRVFPEFQFIFVTGFKMKITETEAADSAPCLYFLFYKSTKFCCYYESIQIKVDPLQIRLMYCSYLYDRKMTE